MTEMETYFFEAFTTMTRLAPGSESSTKQAISLYNGRSNANLQILDVGCGNGVHTLLLATLFPNATITAIDNHAPFIETLTQAVGAQGLSHRVTGKVMDMLQMPFADESFDLIWSEGSIYIKGFEAGIREWKRMLKKNGVLICSEAVWLTDTPSPEIHAFWHGEYPEIDTISHKLQQISAAGYRHHCHFIMPASDWEAYYRPLQDNLNLMLEKYRDNRTAQEVIAMLQREINLFYQYGQEYSYAFFAMFS